MKENSIIKEKILQLVAFHRDVKEDFFSKIGLTNDNFKGENKKRPINSDAIVNILAQYPEISAEWLLTGKGNMLKGEVKAVADTPPLADSVTNALIQRISEQGEEIGRLKRENEELKRQGGSGALGAAGFGNANTG